MDAYSSYVASEHPRVAALHAAIGALPAAALVLGSEVVAGAPLFMAATIALVAAYLHWNASAASIWRVDQNEEWGVSSRDADLRKAAAWAVVKNFAYGAASLIFSAMGFAAVYSDLRLPVSVEAGFLATGAWLALVLVETGFSRFHLGQVLRAPSVENAA